jgi:hypothetical protein
MDTNELPQTPVPTSQPVSEDLQAQVTSLRSLVNTLLILVIVVSGTLNIYFWRQYRTSKGDLNAINQQAPTIINDYNTKQGPMMDEFIKKIAEYGRTHPDFAPIMTKYGLNQYKAGTGAPPVSASPPLVPKK